MQRYIGAICAAIPLIKYFLYHKSGINPFGVQPSPAYYFSSYNSFDYHNLICIFAVQNYRYEKR
mgnify:CR=1 FL=1